MRIVEARCLHEVPYQLIQLANLPLHYAQLTGHHLAVARDGGERAPQLVACHRDQLILYLQRLALPCDLPEDRYRVSSLAGVRGAHDEGTWGLADGYFLIPAWDTS